MKELKNETTTTTDAIAQAGSDKLQRIQIKQRTKKLGVIEYLI